MWEQIKKKEQKEEERANSWQEARVIQRSKAWLGITGVKGGVAGFGMRGGRARAKPGDVQ